MPRLAELDVEGIRAEFDKYAVPLLLLHGAWTGPWVWRRTASYLSHRGWNCWAASWRTAAATWPEARACVERAAAELGRPVVIGHDLGALLALELDGVSAAVAVAPVEIEAGAGAHPLARSLRARVARWRGAPFAPGEAPARRFLGLAATELTAEPVAVEGWRRGALARRAAPRLLLSGERDPCLDAAAADALAAAAGAERIEIPEGGHDLPYGPLWQAAAAEIHRWLVRRLGGDLLLLRGDEDLRED